MSAPKKHTGILDKLEKLTVGISLYFIISYLVVLSLGVLAKPAYDVLFSRPIEAFETYLEMVEFEKEPFSEWLFYEERNDKKGVTIYDKAKAADGYTFFSTTYGEKALLIDMDGNVVHKWEGTLDRLLPDFEIDWRLPLTKRHWCRVYLQPDEGSVYIQYCLVGQESDNIGIVKLDKDSNVVWHYNERSHHDLVFAENGDIYVLANEMRNEPRDYLPYVKPPYAEEYVAVLDKNGKEKARYSILEMMNNSNARQMLSFLTEHTSDFHMQPGDILHPNTITIIPENVAGKAPMLKTGDVMVSIRNLDILAVFDLEKKKATWSSYGPWKGQHSPQFLEDGSIVMFDNRGNLSKEGDLSRILRVDLNDLSVLWEYTGTDEDPLRSNFNAWVDVLDNGNILATETEAGRLLEITPEKEIVWEYYVPDRLNLDEKSRIPSIFHAKRYTAEELTFLDK